MDLEGGWERTDSTGFASKAWIWSMGQRRHAVTLFVNLRAAFFNLASGLIEVEMFFSPSSLVGPERYLWGINSSIAGFRSLVSSPRAALMLI